MHDTDVYKRQEQDFCTSLEYAKTAFAQIYLLDCLVEQKKIKNLKEYLESVEFEDMGADSIDSVSYTHLVHWKKA